MKACASVQFKYVKGFNCNGPRISSLLFADDVVLLSLSGGDLQLTLEQFEAECESGPPNLKPWSSARKG